MIAPIVNEYIGLSLGITNKLTSCEGNMTSESQSTQLIICRVVATS